MNNEINNLSVHRIKNLAIQTEIGIIAYLWIIIKKETLIMYTQMYTIATQWHFPPTCYYRTQYASISDGVMALCAHNL